MKREFKLRQSTIPPISTKWQAPLTSNHWTIIIQFDWIMTSLKTYLDNYRDSEIIRKGEVRPSIIDIIKSVFPNHNKKTSGITRFMENKNAYCDSWEKNFTFPSRMCRFHSLITQINFWRDYDDACFVLYQ